MSVQLANATLAIDCRLDSGISTILRNVVPRLAGNIKRILLLGRENLLDRWKIHAENVEYVKFDVKAYDPREQYRFPWKILETADLLHVPHYNVPLVWPKRLVVTLNDLVQFDPEFGASPLMQIFAKAFIHWSLWRANELLTLSRHSREDFIRNFGTRARRLRVVYPGVDRCFFRPIDKTKAWNQIRQQTGIADPYILAVGSVRPHKNISGLLKAYSLAKEMLGIKQRLVIVGEREGFITKVPLRIPPEVKGHIEFTGRVSDDLLPALYACADLFVFASRYEGFGIPPLEAMACGVPTIASNRTALPEVVGNASILIDPDDTKQFGRAICDVLSLSELREQLVKDGYLRAAQFEWETTAQLHLEAYSRALES